MNFLRAPFLTEHLRWLLLKFKERSMPYHSILQAPFFSKAIYANRETLNITFMQQGPTRCILNQNS